MARTLNKTWQLPPHLALLNRKLVAVAQGKVRRLMVFMPPRHGKSELCSHFFPVWFLQAFPQRRVMLAAYEASFAATWGRKVRDDLQEAGAQGLIDVRVSAAQSAASGWSLEQFNGRRWRPTAGGMITAGVGGPLTGWGFDLGIIDDPLKNSEEAQSATIREKQWDWYQSTFATRAEPGAAIILIMTRWHADDLAGRLLLNSTEPWDVVSFPAIAEEADVLGRQPGEALWPARYDAASLDVVRRDRGSYWWASMYQQRPAPREGGYFKREWFRIVDAAPADVKSRARYWDKAATEGGGDYTVGARLSVTAEGVYTIEDIVRGQWSSGAVKKVIEQTAAADEVGVRIGMEQEPGSSGKDVIADYRRALAGYSFRGYPATGSKEVRADPLASQCEGGNVQLVRAPWNEELINELCSFPNGAHDDMVDAVSGSFSMLRKPGGTSIVYV